MSEPLPAALADERARSAHAVRFAALAGVSLGLASAALLPPAPAGAWAVAAILAFSALAWRRSTAGILATLLLAALAASAGGEIRLSALDSRALHGAPGAPLEATGFALGPARPAPSGGFRFPVQLPQGRIEVDAAGDPDLSVGDRVYLSGRLTELDRFDRDRLLADGIAMGLEADKAEPVPGSRPGLLGALDSIRRRGEAALDRGTSATSAALLRGFILGEDEGISDPIRDQFKRSGLTHILAVSGQNVILLALLATPLLALLGVPLRLRFVFLIALIAIYVPVAGGGPSIVRAGAMGIAGLVAAMASRPSSRWYALLLSAAFTLAIDPRFVTDVGWQLSFAAVLGILLLAKPLTQVLSPRSRPAGPLRRALIEGTALTIAATLTTAPLIAAHFETVSLTTLPANLLAAPAIAPAMWLGMSSAAIGQIPGAPVEPLSFLGGLCAGFIGWVAHLFGGEGAQLAVAAPGPRTLVAIYVAIAIAAALAIGFVRRRRAAMPSVSRSLVTAGRSRTLTVLAAALASVGLFALIEGGRDGPAPVREAGMTVNFLDVGQGDSILVRTSSGQSMLVDVGPPGSGVAGRLRELGVDRLTALAITHDESDHAGGLASVLAGPGARRLVVSQGGIPRTCAQITCPPATEVARGDVLRVGNTAVRVLWPPPAPPRIDRDADRNLRSLVLLVRYRRFRLLLTGDAEEGFAPVHPGNIDVLKVAHHGSEDSGLGQLLDEATPALGVISVGAGNSYGHPTPETLEELVRHDVEAARTDLDGEVDLEVYRRRWHVG